MNTVMTVNMSSAVIMAFSLYSFPQTIPDVNSVFSTHVCSCESLEPFCICTCLLQMPQVPWPQTASTKLERRKTLSPKLWPFPVIAANSNYTAHFCCSSRIHPHSALPQ